MHVKFAMYAWHAAENAPPAFAACGVGGAESWQKMRRQQMVPSRKRASACMFIWRDVDHDQRSGVRKIQFHIFDIVN